MTIAAGTVGGKILDRNHMTTLHLIDGTYELFRAHFGAPPRTTPEGWEIGAVHSMLLSTLNLLAQDEPMFVGAAFDSVIESFRNDMYDGYKTGAGTPPELHAQFPVAERAMEAIGVTVWSMIDQEADDGLAAAAKAFVDDVDRVVIHSPDKDMTQLFGNPKIVGYDRRKQTFTDADGVREKFGVSPESIPDYLGLVGDTADGFPGLPGWGAKSAGSLLARYEHIEGIPASSDDWDIKVRGAAKLAATLSEKMSDALLFRDLATLRTDADVPQSLEDLRWKGAHRDEFDRLCDELGFTSIRNRPTRWAGEN
jgi:5'-3' exonuclease